MISKNDVKVETIDCDICLEQIPDSVKQNAEADEYVANYCGLECYDLWLAKSNAAEAKKKHKT